MNLGRELEQEVDRLGLEFLADFYAAALARRPGDLELITDLAEVYTRLGRVDDGLALDRELVARLPTSPTVRYNLACSLALSADVDGACTTLAEAVELGYRDLEHLLQDDDLRALHGDVRFEALVERLRSLANEA